MAPRSGLPRRGEDLCQVLGVDDQAFGALRRIRNEFVRADERLEALLYLADPDALFQCGEAAPPRTPGREVSSLTTESVMSCIRSEADVTSPRYLTGWMFWFAG